MQVENGGQEGDQQDPGRKCLQVLACNTKGQVGEESWVCEDLQSPGKLFSRFSVFSSRSFRILGLTLRSFIYFILNSVRIK